MKHRAAASFWECYGQLPDHIQKIADQKFKLLKSNPHHPSLRFKKIDQLWSVRINLDYRALADFDGEDYLWIWIGPHSTYDRRL